MTGGLSRKALFLQTQNASQRCPSGRVFRNCPKSLSTAFGDLHPFDVAVAVGLPFNDAAFGRNQDLTISNRRKLR
jgi:hypothetical protein